MKQVVPWPSVQPLPGTAEGVVGGFDYRGTIVALVDLRGFLGVRPAPESADRLVIISEFNRLQVGIAINTANRIHRLTWGDVRTPPESQRETMYRGMVGTVLTNGQMIRILNVEEILAQIGLGDSSYVGKQPVLEPAHAPAADARVVLVVDDSSVMRNMLTRLLETAGYRPLVCRDGHEAWMKIQAFLTEARKQRRPVHDLLPLGIFDIEMPRMDGFTLTRHVKENVETLGIKIILHTSLAGPENVSKGRQMGADAFSVKFDGPGLLAQMRRLLG